MGFPFESKQIKNLTFFFNFLSFNLRISLLKFEVELNCDNDKLPIFCDFEKKLKSKTFFTQTLMIQTQTGKLIL